MDFRVARFYIVLLNVLKSIPWTCAERCDGKIHALGGYYGNLRGSFSSPNSPLNYETKDSCTWVVKVEAGYRVKLTFTRFDLENCQSCRCDSVKVIDGKLSGDKVIGRYCGSQAPSAIRASGRYLRVEFDSDAGTTKKGFIGSYTAFKTGQENVERPTYQEGLKTVDPDSPTRGNNDSVKGHSITIIASLSAIAGVAVIGIVAFIMCRQSRRPRGQRGQSSATHSHISSAAKGRAISSPPPMYEGQRHPAIDPPAYSEVVGTADHNYRPPSFNPNYRNM